MHTMYIINCCVGITFLLCYAYQLFYIGVTLVKKQKPHTGEIKLHRFAVMISARNEEKVIGGLIESIKTQDYPSDLITVFVVADNCSEGDRTAEIARKAGAVVYVREDKEKIGKGFALEFLLSKISDDYKRDAFDAFFVFDADNILSPDYITEMNKTYCDGYRVLTSYRNSKNYGDNWISAGYALWFLREAKYLNNSRMILGTSCAISGTGFMIDRSIFENEEGRLEWKYFLLTEDIEFTAANVVNGEIIGYCDNAVFYDEQPVSFKQSWNQRMRWAKGYLQVYAGYGRRMLCGIFKKREKKENCPAKRDMRAFSCFDMTMTTMPAMILSGFLAVADILAAFILLIGFGQVKNAMLLFSMPIINASILVYLIGLITTVTEWKNIHTKNYKKILYSFTFPFFMLTYIPIALVSPFKKKVEWKHIDHSRSVTLDEIKSEGGEKLDVPSVRIKIAPKAEDNNKQF